MRLHKVEITLTAVAFVRSNSAEEAVTKAQEIKGQVMVLDPSQDLVFSGSLASRRRPYLSVSPTLVCIDVESEALLVHRS